MRELVVSHWAHLAIQSIEMALEVFFGGKIIIIDSSSYIPEEKKLFEHFNVAIRARFEIFGQYQIHNVIALVPLYKFGGGLIVKDNVEADMVIDDRRFVVRWGNLKNTEISNVYIVDKYSPTTGCITGSDRNDRTVIARHY